MLDTPPFTSVNSTMEQFSPLAPQLPVWRKLIGMGLAGCLLRVQGRCDSRNDSGRGAIKSVVARGDLLEVLVDDGLEEI